MPKTVMELAEMDTALGRNEQALLRIERVLAATKPIEEISFWVRAILARARARLALGRDAGEDAKKFEELAPHFTE